MGGAGKQDGGGKVGRGSGNGKGSVRLRELAYVPSSLLTKARGQIALEGLTDSRT